MEEVKKQGMESLFVPYEIALDLKELGFDEPCFGYYLNREFNFFYNTIISERINSKTKDIFNSDVIVAPLYQQAFRWFRKEHEYIVPIEEKWFSNTDSVKYQFRCPDTDKLFKYNSYEDAELECLKKLIEIIKRNK